MLGSLLIAVSLFSEVSKWAWAQEGRELGMKVQPEYLQQDNSDFVRGEYQISQTRSSCSVLGSWSGHQFTATRNCAQQLRDFLGQPPPRVSVVTVGDSTMWRLSTQGIMPYLPKKCGKGTVSKRQSGKCGLGNYMGVKFAPAKCTSGANGCLNGIVHGNRSQACFDCSGCQSFHWESKTGSCSFEYLGVMFADPLPPTNVGLWTKEGGNGTIATASKYLEMQSSTPQWMCFVNHGMHDMPRLRMFTIVESANQFVLRVKQYMANMFRACKHVVWLTQNAVMHETMFEAVWYQHNDKIELWNMKVAEAMQAEEYRDRVFVFDIYNMSHHRKQHFDNAHMSQSYYSAIASWVTSML